MDSHDPSAPTADPVLDALLGGLDALPPVDVDQAAMWAAIEQHAHGRHSNRHSATGRALPPAETLRPVTRSHGLRLALGFAVALLIGAGLWQVVPTAMGDRHAFQATLTRNYATRAGQRATVLLPDGSSVTLAPASRLTYASDADGHRRVKLDGQAYFAIAHDAGRTFQVVAHDVTTRVLGTAFSVRSYRGEPAVQVAVAEGKVAVGNAAGEAILQRGDLVRTSASVRPVVQRDPHGDALAWVRGALAFRDVPLRDALTELERVYDLDLRLATPALGSKRMTLTLTGESPQEMLSTVSTVLDLSYQQHGRVVLFTHR